MLHLRTGNGPNAVGANKKRQREERRVVGCEKMRVGGMLGSPLDDLELVTPGHVGLGNRLEAGVSRGCVLF